jgi:hypothetical protein
VTMVNVVESNLLSFVEKMKEIPNSEELLTEIFELHFIHTEKHTLAMELHSHITQIFKIDAMTLLQYLADMNSLINSDDSYIKTINRLKMKYGYFINELLKRIQNPFLISGAEFNVENGSSVHKFLLRRVDGTYFEAQFNPGTFLPIVNLFINALRQSIEKGIYNLNEQDIENFLKESNQLADLFQSLLQIHKGGQH